MGRKVTGPQDFNVRQLIRTLENTKISVWKVVADTLKKARRSRVEANIGRLNRITADGDVIVIPGKVLGTGPFDRKITIGALAWSASVEEKIKAAGSKIMDLHALVESYPSGSNVKLIK